MKSRRCFIRFIGALCLTLVYLTLTVFLLCTSNSFAGGAKEISQRDVPLVITKPGSYCLISNLTVSSPDVSAITNNADNVTIDLNGFTISGPGKGVGTGFGIKNNMLRGVDNVTVRGGTVMDFGVVGIHLHGTNNRVENVHVFRTGQTGIFVGTSSVVSQCQVAFCFTGIGTDDGSMVLNNTIYSIDHIGINTSGGGNDPVGGVTVMGNDCRLSFIGINVKGQGNRVEGNTVTKNVFGIDLSAGIGNYFAKNLLQGNGTALIGDSNNTNGDSIDPALSNIILP